MKTIPALRRMTLVFPAVVLALGATMGCSRAAPPVGEVPEFGVRVRVLESDGKAPAGDQAFRLGMEAGKGFVEWKGGAWSEWLESDRENLGKVLAAWPNANNGHFQILAKCAFSSGGKNVSTRLEVESALEGGEPSKSEAILRRSEDANMYYVGAGWGHDVPDLPKAAYLGLMIWKDDAAKLHIDTLAGHGRRAYGQAMKNAQIAPEDRPQQIIIGDSYRGADEDLINWKESIGRLAGLGFNAIHHVPTGMKSAVQDAGISKVWGGVVSPPGWGFNWKPEAEREAELKAFVGSQVDPVYAAGWKQEDIAFWATNDEPAWYYPTMYNTVNKEPLALAAFHEYLKKQKLTPQNFGKTSWPQVQLIGRKEYSDLPSRRLFYWSNRFVPWIATKYMSEVTKNYEARIRPDVPVFINFNNFMGTMYNPGPVANNPDKTSPNAAMGAHDWMEVGRERGATSIATEDWIGDTHAFHWSYFAERLRSAARTSDVGFGGLIIPRTSGELPNGMTQKLMALVGHGAKNVYSFIFGPEYAFPSNCYSEYPHVFKPLSTAMKHVAQAEDLLYPGQAREPQVAILTPQSAQFWDLEDQEIATGLYDATNVAFANQRMAYMTDTNGIWRALSHAATPVRFVDEQHLAERDLKNIKVLYITTPDLPREAADGVLQWVREGGTLVTSAGTGFYDRYHQPDNTLAKAAGYASPDALRMIIVNPSDVTRSGTIKNGAEQVPVFGDRETARPNSAKVLASYDDGAPALLENAVGQGRILHWACYPGVSYKASASKMVNGQESGFSDSLRALIVEPAKAAKVELPVVVKEPQIEAPALYSDKGVAVTLLNWTGEEKATQLTIRVDRKVSKVESIGRGALPFKAGAGNITVNLPVGDVDVVKVYY